MRERAFVTMLAAFCTKFVTAESQKPVLQRLIFGQFLLSQLLKRCNTDATRAENCKVRINTGFAGRLQRVQHALQHALHLFCEGPQAATQRNTSLYDVLRVACGSGLVALTGGWSGTESSSCS